jgi:hydrogenase maturation protein HypF
MSLQAPSRAARRVQARVEGVVQGVGFRPHVFRLAAEHGLGGFVLNDAHGVLLEVEGAAAAVDEFLERVAAEAPPLAVVERLEAHELGPLGDHGFEIRASPRSGRADTPVAVDSATCDDCLRELADPDDRRYRYPFINCTNCGPRFTIVCGVPYDRPYTTMAGFQMCERCRTEYEDPTDRRFHAQPNACADCGPRVALLTVPGAPAPLGDARDAVDAAAAALLEGRILAIKGVGGFHLACRADDELAVARLRARKHREDKPFALMAPTVDAAAELVELGQAELALLGSRARPIVLARSCRAAAAAASLAPGLDELGVMLPYSPLHHLLLVDLGERCRSVNADARAPALVMTSGNISDEPIAFEDADALRRLAAIADLLLLHDRPIETRTDDSVVRVAGPARDRRTVLLRRSRGYVPDSLPMPDAAGTPILGCGAELKSTFCLANGRRAWVSHHIGDLENYETWRSYTEGITHFERLLTVSPRVLAHDLHPEYLSSKYAAERDAERLIAVQHHHAHMAACLAEHGEAGVAVGAIFDGSGYGLDGTIWGGELLLGDVERFERVGMLLPVRLPGAAAAIREPWRMACEWLALSCGPGGDDRAPAIPPGLRGRVDEQAWRQVAAMSRRSLNSPLTSSVGRLFDAVGAICGLRTHASYEGQAAIELEAACDPAERRRYPVALERREAGLVIDPRPAIRRLAADLAAGASAGAIASRFHAGVAAATVAALARAASAGDTELVVLSGGVFQNRRLLREVIEGVTGAGLRVLIPERLPIGDGGISYGQAVVAARRLAAPARRPSA